MGDRNVLKKGSRVRVNGGSTVYVVSSVHNDEVTVEGVDDVYDRSNVRKVHQYSRFKSTTQIDGILKFEDTAGTVADFNKIFKGSKIVGFPNDALVTIGEFKNNGRMIHIAGNEYYNELVQFISEYNQYKRTKEKTKPYKLTYPNGDVQYFEKKYHISKKLNISEPIVRKLITGTYPQLKKTDNGPTKYAGYKLEVIE